MCVCVCAFIHIILCIYTNELKVIKIFPSYFSYLQSLDVAQDQKYEALSEN